MSRIALMQPYLLPYAGYFRLMRGVDAFVVGDSVQFVRNGWVHRNRLTDDLGRPAWLTLPIARAPVGTRIGDLGFAPGADTLLPKSMNRFAACRAPPPHTADIVARLAAPEPSPMALIVDLLRAVGERLGPLPPFVTLSSLGLPDDLRGQDVVLAAVERLGAREYVNAPGGRALYDAAAFRARGRRLLFLEPYEGDHASILQRLHDGGPDAIRREIEANMRVADA